MTELLSNGSGFLDLVRIVAPLVAGMIGGALVGEFVGVRELRKNPERISALPQLMTALGTSAGGVTGLAVGGVI